MRRKTSSALRLPVLAALVVGLLTTSAADGARLTEVSRQEVRLENGRPVEPAPGPRRITAEATGAGVTHQLNIFTIAPPPDATGPAEGSQAIEAQVLFLIEPEAGDAIGDCVLLDFSYSATGDVAASGGADARVGFGGSTVVTGTDPVSISFGGRQQITLNPGPDEVVVMGGTPTVIGPGDPPITDGAFSSLAGVLAHIGDEVELRLSSATAWNVPPGSMADGNTEAMLSAEVREGAVACPAVSVVEVPALDTWGLGALALLLAGVGSLTLVCRRPA